MVFQNISLFYGQWVAVDGVDSDTDEFDNCMRDVGRKYPELEVYRYPFCCSKIVDTGYLIGKEVKVLERVAPKKCDDCDFCTVCKRSGDCTACDGTGVAYWCDNHAGQTNLGNFNVKALMNTNATIDYKVSSEYTKLLQDSGFTEAKVYVILDDCTFCT